MTKQNPSPEIIYEGRLHETGSHFDGRFSVRAADDERHYVTAQVTFSAATSLQGYRQRPFSESEIDTLIKCWGTEIIRRYLGEGKQLLSTMSLTSDQLPEVTARELLRRCRLD